MTINKNPWESWEEKNTWEQSINIKYSFLKSFTSEILSGNDKNQFCDEVIMNDTISPGWFIEKELQKFQAKNRDFWDFDILKLSIYELKNFVSKEYLSLKNTKENYLEQTLLKFDLNNKEQKKLEDSIKSKDEVDLSNMIISPKKNLDYLNSIFWVNKVHKKTKVKILDTLSEKEISKRLKKLWDKERKDVEYVLANLHNLVVKNEDIKELFATNFLILEEKQRLLTEYVPYIDLQRVVELWLATHQQAEKKKDTILRKLLWKDFSWDDLDEVIKYSSLADINLKTQIYFKKEGDIDLIADKIGFSNLEKEFKEELDEMREDVKRNWPQSLDDLKAIISGEEFSWKFDKINNFNEWNYIKIESKQKDWTNKIAYWKISTVSNLEKYINVVWVGWNWSGTEKINLNTYTQPEKRDFTQFIKNFQWNQKKASFYTVDELNNIIDDPRNDISGSELRQYTPKDLQQSPELVDELQKKYKENKSNEIDQKSQEIEDLKSELKILESQKKPNKTDIKNKKTKIDKEEQFLKELVEQAGKLNNASISTNDLLHYSNKIELEKKIDEIDGEWKGIKIGVWMYISSKVGIHKILSNDWEAWIIELEHKGENWIEKQKLDYDWFYQAFKANKANRVKALDNLEAFLDANKNKNDLWSNYKVKNWKIVIDKKPEYSTSNDDNLEYLISGKSDNLYKIESIDWDNITIRWWERKKINWLDDKVKSKYKSNIEIWKDGKPVRKDGKIQYEWEILNISKDSETITLTEFNLRLKDEKEDFHPDWQIGKYKTISNPQNLENKFHGWFWTKLFNNISLSELFLGWKMLVDNFEEYFKKWNDIHSAQVALSLWKFLPEEVRAELLIRVERAEDESTDKEIEALWKVDSPIATWRIKDWLLNKDTPEYKKEAWMLFMVKKYWHLNAKELTKFAWKFLWYEAFGWRIWDELYLDIQNQAKERDQTFTEEFLMYILVKKQCWDKWYKWKKRRSRLHKTFKSSWPEQWIKWEFETGHVDASDERTARAMVDGGIWEMEWGTITNAIWWFKKAIERWWSIEEMSEWFFTLLYSGAIFNVDQKTYLLIKGLWDWEKMPMIMARFSSFKSDMHLFNDTVLELSKRIGDEYSDEFPWIKKAAQDLYNDANNLADSDKSRLERAQKFWKDYWTPLSNALNMRHTWNTKYSRTNKIIITEKDNNTTFNSYFEKVRWFTTEWTFWEAWMDDAMWEEGIAGLNTNEVIKQYAQLYTWWTIKDQNKNIVDRFWWKIWDDINSVWWSDFPSWDTWKRKYLAFIIQDIISAFVSNNGWSEYLNAYATKSPFKDDMEKWWITADMLSKFNTFSAEKILEWTDPWVKNLVNIVVENILSWSHSWWDEVFESGFSSTQEAEERTKDKTDHILD